MKYAHYFKQGQAHYLTISTGPRPVGSTIKVEGKRDARKQANKLQAMPYNF